MLFCWDHIKKITRSVFMMDRVFLFYVRTHHKCLQWVFRVSGQYLEYIATCPKKALYGKQNE